MIKKSLHFLVTGGCGFIGSNLSEFLLSQNHNVTIIDNLSTGRLENISEFRNKVNFIQADLSVKGHWVEAFSDVDYVIHLAALADIVPSIVSPSAYYESNVNGTFNVLECCRNSKIKKIMYAASSSCYGLAEEYPTPETANICPQYPYALTKRLGEELVMHWNDVYGLPAISLRFFNVYGPKSRTSGTYGAVFGVFLAQKLSSKPFTVVGDGTQTRDFTYVGDICSAIYEASTSNASGQIFNVGSNETVSINRIVELLGGPVTYIPKRPGEPDCTYADISKISNELGWQPKVSIEEGIKILLDNIEYWKDAPVWNPDSIKEATSDWFKYLKND